MHTGVVEAVVTLVVGGLAETVEIFGDARIGGVVLTRNRVQLGRAQMQEQLLRKIELGGLRQIVISPVWMISAGCWTFRSRGRWSA